MDDDAYQAWFERTWSEREDQVGSRYGPSQPPGSAPGHVLGLPRHLRLERPGACVQVFRPVEAAPPERIERTTWSWVTHALTQPLRPGERAGSHEFALETVGPTSWAPGLLQLLVAEVVAGVEYGIGHRVAAFLGEGSDRPPFLGPPEHHGVSATGSMRWLLLWPHLAPWGEFATETGSFVVLAGTGVTEDEFALLDEVDRCGHHLQLLLCERDVGQVTDPDRASVLSGADGRRAWERIRGLTPAEAWGELVTRFARRPEEPGAWPFADPPRTACFTLRRVLAGGDVLHVTHDAEDGAWQFLDGGEARVEDAAVVGLGEMVRLDPRLAQLAELPLGWAARRERVDAPWRWEVQVAQREES